MVCRKRCDIMAKMIIKIREMGMAGVHAVHSIGAKAKELWASEDGTWYSEMTLRQWLASKGDDKTKCIHKDTIIAFRESPTTIFAQKAVPL